VWARASPDPSPNLNSQALTTFHYLLCCAITGAAGLQGAAQLAAPLVDLPVEEHKRVVDQLIYRQAALTFSSGFLTGLGGIFTMPLAVPTALAAAYIVRFRLCLVSNPSPNPEPSALSVALHSPLRVILRSSQ
jgi:hypothetical protein